MPPITTHSTQFHYVHHNWYIVPVTSLADNADQGAWQRLQIYKEDQISQWDGAALAGCPLGFSGCSPMPFRELGSCSPKQNWLMISLRIWGWLAHRSHSSLNPVPMVGPGRVPISLSAMLNDGLRVRKVRQLTLKT